MNFNSKMVRLEVFIKKNQLIRQGNFNSKMVRLEENAPTIDPTETPFQFQNGTIRSPLPSAYKPISAEFQFQNGTIRRYLCNWVSVRYHISIPKWYD